VEWDISGVKVIISSMDILNRIINRVNLNGVDA
jgi:hypothetical protein